MSEERVERKEMQSRQGTNKLYKVDGSGETDENENTFLSTLQKCQFIDSFNTLYWCTHKNLDKKKYTMLQEQMRVRFCTYLYFTIRKLLRKSAFPNASIQFFTSNYTHNIHRGFQHYSRFHRPTANISILYTSVTNNSFLLIFSISIH